MSTHGDGGKGSGRRNEDVSKVKSNWDLIDWSNKGESKVTEDYDEDEYEAEEHDDTCTWCRGTGEGSHDGASCRKCHGTGIEPFDGVDDDYI